MSIKKGKEMTKEELLSIINNQNESGILEFKENFNDGNELGNYISALGNSALMIHSPVAYFIWGIEDVTKKIVGTKFDPEMEKSTTTGGIPFITYIEKFVNPRIELKFETINIETKKVVVLTINLRHVTQPIKFNGKYSIRSGSSLCNLEEFPEKMRALWLSFESSKFESNVAKSDIDYNTITSLLDIDFYIKTKSLNQLSDDQVLKELIHDKVIENSNGNLNITNLGAYTLAKNINDFDELKYRTLRITAYSGNKTLDNAKFNKKGQVGVAIGFENVIKNIVNLLPYKENYEDGQRKDIPKFPKIAIRELVANALVHQDFTNKGERPFIEVFDNRIEISNPGIPLIEPDRFLDHKPKSRNNDLANFLGEMRIVESRGTGIDKVVNSLEEAFLPALEITTQGQDTTVVTLREWKKFDNMSTQEKIQAIYWHACLKYRDEGPVNNKSIRSRFKVSKNDGKKVSNAIAASIDAGFIKQLDPASGRRYATYIPYWGESIKESSDM